MLREQLAAAKATGVLVPQVVYGYFAGERRRRRPGRVDRRESRHRARAASTTRASGSSRACASPTSSARSQSGEADYAAFHIVTMGAAVSRGDRGGCSRSTGTRTTCCSTGSASRWPRRWPSCGTAASARSGASSTRTGRRSVGLFRQQYRGGRYSWGYPACPDLEDNATVAELLGADRLGIEVSEETGWQYQPEQTTSAIICHHPRAKYFVAR